jgi:predicted TIM-barrel fold metal-dependent hydrolase
MRIIDAQVHIWGSGTPSGDHRQTPVFTAEELLAEMDAAGVDAAVIHPPVSWDPEANALAEAAAARYPQRFAVLGQVPLDRPEASRPLLQGWRARPGQCGLRYPLVRADQHAWPFDGTMDWLWPAAEEEGLPVATMAWRFLPEFAAIAERHPRLRLIIDHCGLIRHAKGAAAFANLDAVCARTSRSRPPAPPPIRARPIPSATSMTGCTASSTPSDPTASSGARTSPACPAPGGNA